MIHLPHRSVTRFFIPMIDVLTLLFCIYLLMPMVSATGESEPDSMRREREEKLRALQAELVHKGQGGEEVAAKLRAEIEKLRQEKGRAVVERLAVRVLEIDPGTGHLFYRDPARIEVRNEADAHRLIDRDGRLKGLEKRELFYLILYPREPSSSFPTVGQKESYDRWFQGVALGYDVPGREPGRNR